MDAWSSLVEGMIDTRWLLFLVQPSADSKDNLVKTISGLKSFTLKGAILKMILFKWVLGYSDYDILNIL